MQPSIDNAVDVVVAWVDGGDPKHRAKRRRCLADPDGGGGPERVANVERRFSDNDEIRFCLRSIRNYAPWVRTIWLVADNQIPAAIDRRSAEQNKIRIVAHREIFRGHEQLLPTVNSYAIESMPWRIEGLADRSLYFNDDMMLVGPAEPTDFFPHEGKIILRGRWQNWKGKPGEPGRHRSAPEAAFGRYVAYGLHQSARDDCRKSSGRDELPVGGDRAGRAFRKRATGDLRFTPGKATVCQARLDVVEGLPGFVYEIRRST
jgi:stealth protein CR2/Stealth-like protein